MGLCRILYSRLQITWGLLAGLVCLLFLFIGCAKHDPDAWLLSDPAYKGWLVESYQNVRLYYAPGHPHAQEMSGTVRKYQMAINSISKTLGLPTPTDTLKVVWYTGAGQGKELTGHSFPFGDSLGVARFWLPFAFGVPVAQIYVRKWDSTLTRHKFLWHGLIALFDFQGENYHTTTLDFLKQSSFEPLATLAEDTVVNSDSERWQSAEAASFCAYIMGNYGTDRFQHLYDSRLPFDQAVSRTIGISLDSAQVEWLQYAHLASPKYKDEIQGDTSVHK